MNNNNKKGKKKRKEKKRIKTNSITHLKENWEEGGEDYALGWTLEDRSPRLRKLLHSL